MSNNKQQTAIQLIIQALDIECKSRGMNVNWDMYLEMEKEKMIKLIQFIISEKELVDYSSVSKDTANYYLDKFNEGGEK